LPKKKKKEEKTEAPRKIPEYIICKTSTKTRERLEKAARLHDRKISKMCSIIVEEWLDDNEI